MKAFYQQLLFGLCRLTAAMLPFSWGCTPPSTAGADLFTDEDFTIEVIDTVQLWPATVLQDSLDTYLPDRLLLGFHQDELLGNVLAAPFFELTPDLSEGLPEKNTTQFDSLVLVLSYDGYFAYDTTALQGISVHRLWQRIETNEDGNLYNTSSFLYRESAIGSLQFRPRPGSLGTIRVRLSDTLGQELFRKAQEADEDLETDEAFKDFFNGLTIRPDTTRNGAVIGLSANPVLELYYRDIAQLPITQRSLSFTSDGASGENLFNHIEADRSGTAWAALQSGVNTLYGRQSQHMSYIQGGTGVYCRIELPYARSLLELNESFVVADATLILRPLLADFSSQFELPESLEIYWVDEDNVLQAQNPYPALLQHDLEFGRDVYYAVNIQAFVEQLIKDPTTVSKALLISYRDPDYNTSIHTVILGDQQHDEAPMSLKLTILDVK